MGFFFARSRYKGNTFRECNFFSIFGMTDISDFVVEVVVVSFGGGGGVVKG